MRARVEFKIFSPEELLGPLNEVERVNAPTRLFVAGKVSLLQTNPRVSVVGSRRASEEGLARAAALARTLAGRGYVVVSGLADGIDTAAHTGAIEAGGSTIAVLGTPLDRVFPARNAALQRSIIEEHLAVSQFQVGRPTEKSDFPRRNRTMALLSHATVIVEAGESSGTLHQGYEALRLGRPLFLFASVAGDPALAWPKEMLRYGAQVLGEMDEIFDWVPAELGGPFVAPPL